MFGMRLVNPAIDSWIDVLCLGGRLPAFGHQALDVQRGEATLRQHAIKGETNA
jgi:hypothetical protein